LRYREWSTIQPSYREWDEARRLAEVEAAAEDLQEDSAEELAVKPGVVPITSKPRVVKAGHRERALPITAGAKSFRFEWETVGVDLRYTAAIHSGEVVVTACIAESKTLESKQHAKRAESTSYESSSGHGCPNGQKIPPNVGTGNTPQKGGVKTTPVEVTHSRAAELSADIASALVNLGMVEVTHSRAAELSSLFDPLIYRWCQRTLSGDPKVLQQACEAIGDTPNDILVKVAVERGSRTLTPLHVPALCRQIAADWQRSKTMPVPPPMGEPQTKGAARAQKLVEGLKALDRLRGKKGA
jgi:ribosomal protein L17